MPEKIYPMFDRASQANPLKVTQVNKSENGKSALVSTRKIE